MNDDLIVDLVEVLLSRSGNRFLVNDELRSISFFTPYSDKVDLYFVNPSRIGAGFQCIGISRQGIAALIKHPTTMLCRDDTIKVPKFYW